MYEPSLGVFAELLGPVLNRGDGTDADTDAALSDVDVVGLYLARWDKPCRAFTRKLAAAYREGPPAEPVPPALGALEVVFLSVEADEVAHRDAFAEMPWLAVPRASCAGLAAQVQANFAAEEAPCFLLLDGRTGDVLTKNGKPTAMEDLDRFKNPLLDGFVDLR